MKLTLFFDHRFLRDPAGVVYSPASYNYDLLARRYLDVFDELRIVTRVQEHLDSETRGGNCTEGPGISVSSVGNWQGPLEYLRLQRRVNSLIADEVRQAAAIMMIAPGRIGQIAASQIQRTNRPYGVEVVGDPYDIFSSGTSDHPLRKPLQAWGTRALKNQTRHASAVAYVSELNLPERYPAADGAFTTHYSSIELDNDHIVDQPRAFMAKEGSMRLVTIGTMSQMYKGIDTLIDAVSLLRRQGFDVSLDVLGDGRYRQQLERRALEQHIGQHVSFLGHRPAGSPIRDALDNADIFVLASRTEGLPRSMIEAMARGLPCIGSNVGGIPDLLRTEEMVEPNDAVALARGISELSSDPQRMIAVSIRNLDLARSYKSATLQERRNSLYSHVKSATERWLIAK